jgi:hypothetical protein
VAHLTRRASRDAALVELQRLHAAIQASRERRGVLAVPPAGSVPPATPPQVLPTPEVLAARELTRRLQTEAEPIAATPEAAPSRRLWWLAAVAAVVVAGVWLAMSQARRPDVVTEAAPPADARVTATPARPDPTTAAPSAARVEAPAATAPAATNPVLAPRAVRVTLETTRPVWLLVMVDGKRAHRGTVEAGQRLSFDGDRAVVVRSGDAGGVTATLNGTDRGALGRNGWPLTVAITPAGLEPLTPTRPEP